MKPWPEYPDTSAMYCLPGETHDFGDEWRDHGYYLFKNCKVCGGLIGALNQDDLMARKSIADHVRAAAQKVKKDA